MFPELSALLDAMADLLLAMTEDQPDGQRVADAREQVKTARAAFKRVIPF